MMSGKRNYQHAEKGVVIGEKGKKGFQNQQGITDHPPASPKLETLYLPSPGQKEEAVTRSGRVL